MDEIINDKLIGFHYTQLEVGVSCAYQRFKFCPWGHVQPKPGQHHQLAHLLCKLINDKCKKKLHHN
jgi:hypothetical protein